jgi:hypothetical protein
MGKTNASIKNTKYRFGSTLHDLTRAGSLCVKIQNKRSDAASGMERTVAKRYTEK